MTTERNVARSRSLLLAVFGCILAAAPARAAAPDLENRGEIITSRKNQVAAHLGLFSAVGELGVTYARTMFEHLQIEVGVGKGFTGTQYSGMVKAVLGGAKDHFVAGVGTSVSVASENEGLPVWLNVDAVGYEHRFESGLSLSFALGFFVGLGGGTIPVTSIFDVGPARQVDFKGGGFAQTRLGLGYWF